VPNYNRRVATRRYRFGPFVLDQAAYRLLRGSNLIDLPPKAVDLLLYLVQRPGTLVTKEELFHVIWPDVVVTDNALTQVVSEIRQALGDAAAAPTYVQTVARRGYRFIGTVEHLEPATETEAPSSRGQVPKGEVNLRPTLAVLDFANLTADTEMAWLSAGIAETLMGDLQGIGRFRVVDRVRLQDRLSRNETALAVARYLGADLLITGGFQRAGEHRHNGLSL